MRVQGRRSKGRRQEGRGGESAPGEVGSSRVVVVAEVMDEVGVTV